MDYFPLSKLVTFQASFAFLNSKIIVAEEDPFVSLPEAQAAVALCHRCEFWDFDVEYEGSTMTVALVGFQIRGEDWFRHAKVRLTWLV